MCPPPPETWCKYRKSEAEGSLADFKHKNSVPQAAMEALKPIFRDLAHPDLLKRCLHGKTQNVNESFNNLLWTRIPKSVFVGMKTLQLGTYDTVITFNNGCSGRLRVLEKLGVILGKHTVEGLHKVDIGRVKKAEVSAKHVTKEARKRRRQLLLDRTGGEDDLEYGAGCF